MKRDWGWKKGARVWFSIVRALTRKRSVSPKNVQPVEKIGLATKEQGAESLNSVCDAISSNGEKDAKIGLNAAVKTAELATENKRKTVSDRTRRAVNKADNGSSGATEAPKNIGADRNEMEAPSCSTADATLNVKSQIEQTQEIRSWKNGEGKYVVQAALEVELTARSPKFVFLRTASGALYRYPLRKLSLADRVRVSEALVVSVANEAVANDEVKVETTDASNGGDGDAFDFCESEATQRLLEQGVGEDDEELRLNFWEDDEDAASLNASEERATSEGEAREGDVTSDDLRLNFWDDDENDVSGESTNEKTSFDEETQPRVLNDLAKVGERKRRARRGDETSAQDNETKNREERERCARRQNEKKRKSLKPSVAPYYELFSRMEPEELDGLLYDYCDNFDAIRDDVEAERIIDYYDRTYGDARYRSNGDELE